jgi:hypothetical protein
MRYITIQIGYLKKNTGINAFSAGDLSFTSLLISFMRTQVIRLKELNS